MRAWIGVDRLAATVIAPSGDEVRWIRVYAPAALRPIPVVGQVAGVVGQMLGNKAVGQSLTANAFNGWALVGPTPLARRGPITSDSLSLLGMPAVLVGGALFATTCVLVVVGLLRRDGWVAIFLGLTVVTVAFFVLPTRIHERYLVPAFAPGALLAATAIGPRLLYVAAAGLYTLNLHAVLSRGVGTLAASPPRLPRIVASVGRTLSTASWDPGVIAIVAVGLTAVFGCLVVAWVRLLRGREPWVRVPDRTVEPSHV